MHLNLRFGGALLFQHYCTLAVERECTIAFQTMIRECGAPHFAFKTVKPDSNAASANGTGGGSKMISWTPLSHVQVRDILSRLVLDPLFKTPLPAKYDGIFDRTELKDKTKVLDMYMSLLYSLEALDKIIFPLMITLPSILSPPPPPPPILTPP